MRFFKIVLLLLYSLLYSMAGNADMVGGHDRQRLSQLFLATLNQYFEATPIQVSKQLFPLTVPDDQVDPLALYTVLAEEGLLSVQVRSGSLEITPDKVQRLFEFDLTDKGQSFGLLLGSVSIQRILKIESLPKEPLADQQMDVQFEWRLENPQPWLWAPSLQANVQVQTYAKAIDSSQTGLARFVFANNRWRIESLGRLIDQPGVF